MDAWPGALVAVIGHEAEPPERVIAAPADDEAAVPPAREGAILGRAVEAGEEGEAAVEEQARGGRSRRGR